jgi:D-alanine-D-alanine ligase
MTDWITVDDTDTITADLATLRAWDTHDLSVAVAYGPVSAEDRLYLSTCPPEQRSSTALCAALSALGVEYKVLDPTQPTFIRSLLDFDIVLSNLHGQFGEDGRLQGMLDYLRVRYCGSGTAACAIAADKILCKRVMDSLGVPSPEWQWWTPDMPEPLWPEHAVMVKPSLGGSSIGMSLIRNRDMLPAALARASAADAAPVLIEEFHAGTPVTIGLLELPSGVLAFPALATRVLKGEWYDATAKLDIDSTNPVAVELADLPHPVLDVLTSYARNLWDGLGCRGQARVDFVVTHTDDIYALELNPTPGMSRDSNFVTGAAMCGITHEDTVRALLHEAATREPYDVPLPTPVLL